MAEPILDALGPVLTRWTMGGSAVPTAPAGWREALGPEPAEAELRLLALSGQFLGAVVVAEPAGEWRVLPDIPALSKPPLAAALRPRARRLLQQLKEPHQRRALLDFLDGRGWTLHPGDWMPGPNEEAPEVYAPWQDWATASGTSIQSADALTAESWDLFGPAARATAFKALRRRDARLAGALLAEKIGGETAEARERLVATLAIGLSDADRPLLEGLAKDRAHRVKLLAASFLAQLGHDVDGREEAVELAEQFSIQTKGFVRRKRVAELKELKTPAQQNRRAVLMGIAPISFLAQALGLTPEELVEAWPWGNNDLEDLAFATMAARSGSAAVVEAMAHSLTYGDILAPYSLAHLSARLPVEQRRAAAMHVLRAKGSFGQAQGVAKADGRLDEVMRTGAGAKLLAALASQDAKPTDQSDELLALGLLTSRAAAKPALEQLAAVGLIASDPRLDMLRLNAALEDRSESRGGTT